MGEAWRRLAAVAHQGGKAEGGLAEIEAERRFVDQSAQRDAAVVVDVAVEDGAAADTQARRPLWVVALRASPGFDAEPLQRLDHLRQQHVGLDLRRREAEAEGDRVRIVDRVLWRGDGGIVARALGDGERSGEPKPAPGGVSAASVQPVSAPCSVRRQSSVASPSTPFAFASAG